MVKALVESDLGCHLHSEYIGCLVYADDTLMPSASVGSLQKMLDVCYRKGETIDIIFNARTSSFFVVGKAYDKKLENCTLVKRQLHGMII